MNGDVILKAWDDTNKIYRRLVCNPDGKLIIDPSEILEDDPTDGEVGKAPTSNWANDHENDDSAHGGPHLPLAGGTMTGDINLNNNALKTTHLSIKEVGGEWLYIRDITETAYRNIVANVCLFNLAVVTEANGAYLRGPNIDNRYMYFGARDNGVGPVEVARLQGAADPYFQATLPMVYKPASQPGTLVQGHFWYNSADDLLKYYDGSNVKTLARTDDLPPGEGHITIMPFSYNSIGQGTWAFSATANQWGGFTFLNAVGAADGDNLVFKVYLAAGTYTLEELGIKGSNHAIIDYEIDGAVIATVDHYAAVGAYNQRSVDTGNVIATSGLKTLTMKANGKNAASSGYFMAVSTIVLWRTA